MSREECYSCGPCGGHCDKCSASCCINIMEEHRRFFDLLQTFAGKVQSTYSQINNHFISLNNELRNNYNIYPYWNGNIVDNFLNAIVSKYEDIKKDIIYIEQNITKLDTEKYNIKKLNEANEEDIKKLESKFNEDKKIFEDKKENEILKGKREKKDTLEKDFLDKKNKLNKEIENNLNEFKRQKQSEEEENYEKRKTEIDQDPHYKYEEIFMVYNEQEQNEKNQYINQILEIKKYNIPKGFLAEYGLNINF
jgi:hypothetical protein